uniref:Uncharacterized protein n=1 Tax=Timema monikensis TaxID=170555 RepID=A0A7R9DZ17_9NEOP|nr:unnamed protein product [Timema monikensis]
MLVGFARQDEDGWVVNYHHCLRWMDYSFWGFFFPDSYMSRNFQDTPNICDKSKRPNSGRAAASLGTVPLETPSGAVPLGTAPPDRGVGGGGLETGASCVLSRGTFFVLSYLRDDIECRHHDYSRPQSPSGTTSSSPHSNLRKGGETTPPSPKCESHHSRHHSNLKPAGPVPLWLYHIQLTLFHKSCSEMLHQITVQGRNIKPRPLSALDVSCRLFDILVSTSNYRLPTRLREHWFSLLLSLLDNRYRVQSAPKKGRMTTGGILCPREEPCDNWRYRVSQRKCPREVPCDSYSNSVIEECRVTTIVTECPRKAPCHNYSKCDNWRYRVSQRRAVCQLEVHFVPEKSRVTTGGTECPRKAPCHNYKCPREEPCDNCRYSVSQRRAVCQLEVQSVPEKSRVTTGGTFCPREEPCDNWRYRVSQRRAVRCHHVLVRERSSRDAATGTDVYLSDVGVTPPPHPGRHLGWHHALVLGILIKDLSELTWCKTQGRHNFPATVL